MARLDKHEGKPGERSKGIGIPVLQTFSESNNSLFWNGHPLFQSQTGHKAEGPRAVGVLPPSTSTWKWGERERIPENGISLTLVTKGCNVGQCVDVSPARQVESPVLELISVSRQSPREGTTRGGLAKGAHPVAVDLPSWVSAPECKVSAEKKRASRQSGKREIY